MIVMKFGGTSVGGAEQMTQVAEIVARFREGGIAYGKPVVGMGVAAQPQEAVIVVSAMSGAVKM